MLWKSNEILDFRNWGGESFTRRLHDYKLLQIVTYTNWGNTGQAPFLQKESKRPIFFFLQKEKQSFLFYCKTEVLDSIDLIGCI